MYNKDTPEIDQQLINRLTTAREGYEKFLVPVISSLEVPNQISQFRESLTKHLKEYPSDDIPNQAKHIYHDFVNMISEYEIFKNYLATMQEDLKCAINDLNTSGRRFLSNLSEEVDNLRTLLNHTLAKKVTQDMSKIMLLAQEANCAILDLRYEEALAKLDQVQSLLYTINQMPQISLPISKWAEEQVKTIRNQATSDLKQWLTTIRDVSTLIGKSLMGQTRARLDHLSKLPPDTPLINQPELCIALLKVPPGRDLPEIETKPLLKISHLFDLMDLSGEFSRIYAENRKLQAVAINDSPLSPDRDLNGIAFNKLLEEICGFFYVDLHIRRLGINSIPLCDSRLEELWSMFLTRIQSLEQEFVRIASSDASVEQATLMNIKWSHLFFSYSIRSFSKGLLDTFSLDASLTSLFYSFVEILKNEHFDRIEALLSNDSKYLYGFSDDLIGIVSNFATNFYRFLEGIPQVNRELEDLAARSLDILLSDNVISSISQSLDKFEIETVVAIVKSFNELITRIPQEFPSQKNRLHAPQRLRMFVMSSIQPNLISQIHMKLDLLVRNANIDFSPSLPQPSPSSLFSELEEILKNFEILFNDIDNLQMIHFEICQHLATRLMGLLLSERYHNSNIYFMSSFKSDLIFLQDFIAEKYENAKLLEHFNELDQTLNLILSDRCHDFLDPIIRKDRYSHVQPANLSLILSRIKDPENKRRSFEDLALLLN